jgi:peptidyl-prolyl cis-trans isomerase D
MFDLFRSRAKAVRYLLIALLSLVALSMVITLIPGFGSSMGQRNEQVIAEVGDTVVTVRMVNQAIQSQMKSQGINREMIELVAPQIIERMIGEYATSYQARKMGFSVSDEELAQGIKMMVPQLFQGGQFVGKDVYQQFLYQMNMTIPEFEAKVRQQLMLNKLQSVVFQGTVVTPKEVEAEFQKKGEKVKLAVVKFDPADYRDQFKPTPAELEAYLQKNQSRFNVPAKRDVGLIVVDEAKLGADIPVDEATLRQMYDSQRIRFQVKERARVRHILIKTEPTMSADEKAKARAQAADIAKQIRAGADFAEMAKKHSADPGSANKGGEYDWFHRDGSYVKPFEDAAFTQPVKKVGDPVETQFGYHIIEVLDRQPARTKPFEEVRDQLATEARRTQLADRMPALADQARAELLKTPDQAEQIAQKLNLSYARAENAGSGDKLPVIGPSGELDANLNTLQKGGVTPVVQLQDNRLVVAVVYDVKPPRPAKLSDMEEFIRNAYRDQMATDKTEKLANEFQAKLNVAGGDIHKVAKEMGVKVIESAEFERTGQIEGVGPAAYFGEQPFVNPVGRVIGIYRIAQTKYFFKILSKTLADPSKLATERDMIVSSIREKKLRERRELFEEGLVRQLTESGDIKVYDDVIKRLITSYRS